PRRISGASPSEIVVNPRMSPKSTVTRFSSPERKLSGLLSIDDRAGDRRRDETTEGDSRPRDRDLFLHQEIAEQDDPPEDGRYHVRNRGDFHGACPDGTLRLEREEDVSTDDIEDEQRERAEEAVQPPAEDKEKSGERDDQELCEGHWVALLQHGIPVGQDRLGGVGPDLHTEHLEAARVRDRVAVGHARKRVRSNED